ncbi:DMT family transporter [Humibacillus sp. DSM 29435]|uniref:DMT family transporter n=1 Tax=Humibacillus sp. DSM 29435 TaxID=1869167 RepID=UPI0020C77463|nr:EamA family transporter [Humibacillus sp. DSM 29435]
MTFTGWQLTIAGVLLAPLAVAVEGPPPALSLGEVLAFGYVALPATAVAYSVWFYGLRRLPAGTVGVIGLLNPLTGTLLGAVLGSERLTTAQIAGAALILGGVLIGLPQHRTRPPPTKETPPRDPVGCQSQQPR